MANPAGICSNLPMSRRKALIEDPNLKCLKFYFRIWLINGCNLDEEHPFSARTQDIEIENEVL